jgi:hypothetical protein
MSDARNPEPETPRFRETAEVLNDTPDESEYSDAALEKQRQADILLDAGEPIPVDLMVGIMEPRHGGGLCSVHSVRRGRGDDDPRHDYGGDCPDCVTARSVQKTGDSKP